jgi:hypothetical protein
MAVDFRGHPMFPPTGFNAPTRFEADVYDCEVWGKIPSDSGARSTGFIPDTGKLIAGRKGAGKPPVSLRLPNHSHLSEPMPSVQRTNR